MFSHVRNRILQVKNLISFCLILSLSASLSLSYTHLSLLQHLIKQLVLLILLNISQIYSLIYFYYQHTVITIICLYRHLSLPCDWSLCLQSGEWNAPFIPSSSFQPNNLSKTQIWIMTSHLQNKVQTHGPILIRSFMMGAILAFTSSTLSSPLMSTQHRSTLSVPRRGHLLGI